MSLTGGMHGWTEIRSREVTRGVWLSRRLQGRSMSTNTFRQSYRSVHHRIACKSYNLGAFFMYIHCLIGAPSLQCILSWLHGRVPCILFSVWDGYKEHLTRINKIAPRIIPTGRLKEIICMEEVAKRKNLLSQQCRQSDRPGCMLCSLSTLCTLRIYAALFKWLLRYSMCLLVLHALEGLNRGFKGYSVILKKKCFACMVSGGGGGSLGDKRPRIQQCVGTYC